MRKILSSVTIGRTSRGIWDFAIDDVRFSPPVSAVPEPTSFDLIVVALGMVAGSIAVGQRRS